MKKLLIAAAVLFPTLAIAGDINGPVLPLKAPVYVSAPCTPQQCSGWYAGVGLSGSGTNADILGSGINNSIFAAGGVLDVHGGYQFFNGQYFAAAEVGVGNAFQPNQLISSIGARTLTGYEVVKLGMGLGGLFVQPSGTPTAGQAPTAITIPSTIANAMLSPYFITGAMQRNGISQWINGAGTEFLLASHWNLDIRYVYGSPISSTNPLNGAPPLNLVTVGLNYHF
jgi:opacity protein-like surface antigen